MTKLSFLKITMLFLLVQAAYGQKVKYKDIFALLSTKQYEQAEPFLKRYLKENDDNPNAFLYMGIIFQEKAAKNDILKQTAMAVSNMDSANIFYDKAYKLIDDREVKRNKEYYQAYNRRDLRTGEFGVKLSDIQFDIEKRIENQKERIDKVKMVKFYFSLADTLYASSNALYRSLQRTYPGERQLYLRADETTVKSLEMLAQRFDSSFRAFEHYKTSSTTLGKTGYNQEVSLVEINDFLKDGASLADLYQEEVKLWEYKKFADKVRTVVQQEILPMRAHLVSYDIEINKLRDKLNADSISVRSDLTKLIDRLLYDQLKKYDPEPLPMTVFSLKTADLEYRSALLENRLLKDTSDVHLRLRLINAEMRLLGKLDSISGKLSSEDITQKAPDYQHFVASTFNSSDVLKSYVSSLKEFAEREKRKKEDELAVRMKALDWIIDGADSIPLKQEALASTYRPLFTADEKYTLGLRLKDSTNADGYFYTITAARKPDVKVLFPIDKSSFKERKLPMTKGLTYSDATGQIYFVLLYSEKVNKDKYPATLAKIYRSDGLAWSNNYQLPFIPKEIQLKQDTGEVTIKNDTQQTVIDKNGKMVR